MEIIDTTIPADEEETLYLPPPIDCTVSLPKRALDAMRQRAQETGKPLAEVAADLAALALQRPSA